MESLDSFQTGRLTAERLQASHLDELLRMDRDPRVMKTLGGLRTEQGTREYLRDNLDHWDQHGFGLWMLRLRSDDTFVGRAALRHLSIEGSDEIMIGYAFLPEYWGMGLATEIASAIRDLAFSRLGLNDLAVGSRPKNRASVRVMEKIGARYERDALYKDSPHLLYRIWKDND